MTYNIDTFSKSTNALRINVDIIIGNRSSNRNVTSECGTTAVIFPPAVMLELKVPLAPVTLLIVILGEPVRPCAKAIVPAEVRYVQSLELSALGTAVGSRRV